MTLRHQEDPSPGDEATTRTAAAISRLAGAIAPALMLHAPAPRALAAVWSVCCTTLLGGEAARTTKEAAAAAIASVSRTPWCFEAHLAMLHAGGAHETASAIARGDYEALGDPALRAIVEWAARTLDPDDPALRTPPFTVAAAPEIVGTAVFAHYLDRLAMILLADSPLPGGPEVLKGLSLRLAGLRHHGAWRRVARAAPEPPLLSAGSVEAPSWASASPTIAAAFAGMSAVLEEAATRLLPESVVSGVHDYVRSWDGEPPSANRQWADRPFQHLGAADLAAGRIALLAALAPHQVDAMVIGELRRHHPDAATLVELVAWGAFTAAARIGSWLWPGRET